jgi:hypothetical protein
MKIIPALILLFISSLPRLAQVYDKTPGGFVLFDHVRFFFRGRS